MASLDAAMSRARELHRTGNGQIRIRMAAGEYCLREALTLGPEDSNLSIEGAGAGKTIISGGRALPGFCDCGNGLWQLSLKGVLAEGETVEQLFISGKRAVRARTPNGQSFFNTGKAEERDLGNGIFSQSIRIPEEAARAISAVENGIPGTAKVKILHGWDVSWKLVLGFSESERSLRFEGAGMKPWLRLDRFSHFYLEDDRSFLDSPGEFYHDREAATLYYIPREGETPETCRAVMTSVTNLVVIKGEPGRRAGNISFKGLSFRHAKHCLPPSGENPRQGAWPQEAAVTVDYADNVHFTDCGISQTGNNGIWFRAACRDCSLERSTLQDLGTGGVKIGTPHKPKNEDEQLTRRILIEGNLIREGGRTMPTGEGVMLFNAGDCTISHNEIADFYYTGVSVGWTWGYAHSPSKRNRVTFNHIHDIGQGILSDMGGVYTLGRSEGTVISDNVIHDVAAFGYGGWGLYTDEGSSDIVMERNLVYNCKSAAFHQHYGRDNIIRNNIFVNCSAEQLTASKIENHNSFTFKGNIIYYTSGRLCNDNWMKVKAVRRCNLYWHEGGTTDILGEEGSIVADPGFRDIKKEDFTPTNREALSRISFKPFNP